MSLTLTSPEGEGFQPSPMGTTKEKDLKGQYKVYDAVNCRVFC